MHSRSPAVNCKLHFDIRVTPNIYRYGLLHLRPMHEVDYYNETK